MRLQCLVAVFCFFFNDPATTEIYTLSLHDALPICRCARRGPSSGPHPAGGDRRRQEDRKSTRLNSSHVAISYAVFCLKKKKSIPYARHFSRSPFMSYAVIAMIVICRKPASSCFSIR